MSGRYLDRTSGGGQRVLDRVFSCAVVEPSSAKHRRPKASSAPTDGQPSIGWGVRVNLMDREIPVVAGELPAPVLFAFERGRIGEQSLGHLSFMG